MWLLFLAFKIAEMGYRRKSDDNGKDLHSHFSFSLAFLEPLGPFPPHHPHIFHFLFSTLSLRLLAIFAALRMCHAHVRNSYCVDLHLTT